MKRQLLKVYPLLVAVAVCGFLQWIRVRDAGTPRSPSVFQRLEWMTEDWRSRLAFVRPAPNSASNLVAVAIDEPDLTWMNRTLSTRPRWPFGHLYYGPFINELKAQGVEAVAFDVFFEQNDDPRPFRAPELTGATNPVMGTAFFAERMRASGNVILGVVPDSGHPDRIRLPVAELATNACAIGLAAANPDRDGVFRRLPVFHDDPNKGRAWCLGFVLAARHLGLDLQRATVGPGRLVLRGEGGLVREVPLTPRNEIYFDWVVHPRHPLAGQRIPEVAFKDVFSSALRRGQSGMWPDDLALKDKLAVVGAAGAGVNLYDSRVTALGGSQAMYLGHVNVANSLLTGRFIRAVSPGVELGIALGLTALATGLGWRLRTLWASLAVTACAGAYVAFAAWLFVAHRVLVPVAVPVCGALLTTHLVMTVCRTLENAERRQLERRLKQVVAPKILETLLEHDAPMPRTRRTEVTVMFADLRAFTRFSEESQSRAEAAARALGLSAEATRAFADEAACDAMNSVNRYLSAAVDEIKASDGTLDKYMGDCVMAFWGAPVADAHHAAQALKCAAATQQCTERINREHAAENQRRGRENERRAAERLPPLPLLPVLRLGVGLNSGVATAGFMGSENHVSSYTVFGHVVNVASRVEGLAGGGQIILTEHTLLGAARNNTTIAARCTELPAVLLKGITSPVKIYELRWQDDAGGPPPSTRT